MKSSVKFSVLGALFLCVSLALFSSFTLDKTPPLSPPLVSVSQSVLAQDLSNVINALEKDAFHYDWTDPSTCNVGLVAQAITHKTAGEISNIYYSDYRESIEITKKPSWTSSINYYCSLTGRDLKGIVGDLRAAGLSNNDIKNLEYLQDPRILARSGIDVKNPDYYRKRDNLIKYLKAWKGLILSQT